jgi:hypothetical protein
MAAERAGCVIQFAKAPVPGRVKTRLHPCLGEAGAAGLSERMIAGVSAALGAVPAGWESVLCADDPGHACFHALAERSGQGLWEQGEGDLGERMARACTRALRSFPAVIVVGSDCTGYDPGYLRRAMCLLASGTQAVLGPAVDGGYVLIGLRRCPEGLFEGIAWGSASVASSQRRRLQQCGLPWQELPPRADVDRPVDLWMVSPPGASQA